MRTPSPGPAFLLRQYAIALRKEGYVASITLLDHITRTLNRPRVLHFGESYVVANKFVAVHRNELANNRVDLTAGARRQR